MQLPPPEAGVSRREGEVLALVGERLTNAEIAERLFISVRTVESHVATLLRKLDLPDKRALAAHAVALGEAGEPDRPGRARASRGATLPVALTSFVGRRAERQALGALVEGERLVTLLGPGGVGKTRLVAVTAADLVGVFEGVWFVDLVPVVDPASVTAAVATTLGVAELPGRTLDEALITWIGDRRLLVVLDNCEHLVDGVAAFAERVLAGCASLTLLTTSRTRLMLPFEHVFAVPGLSLPDAEHPGDAVGLFEQRAAAVGFDVTATDRGRIASICRQLDGVALAIELAASRLPGLGLDGLEAALTEPLRMLSGGTRVHERHHSLRATLDWSWSLLDEERSALLEQVSVFAAPFSATDAAAVVEPEASVATVVEGLAHLVDNSLLVPVPTPRGTRYRALEVVRQYGQDRVAERGELAHLRERHLRWCLGTASALGERQERGDAGWRAVFDLVGDDLRAALLTASDDAVAGDVASHLAALLARLEFGRGNPAETQRRFVQAARLAQRPDDQLAALVDAAHAALAQQSGEDYVRLADDAADQADRIGDDRTAAILRARSAEVIARFRGVFEDAPPLQVAEAYLERAQAARSDDLEVRTTVALAAASVRGGLEAAQEALDLARQSERPVLVSAALDAVTAEQLVRTDLEAATRTVLERLTVLEGITIDVDAGMELNDGYLMAADVLVAAGDLAGAARAADQLAALPFYEGVPYAAISRQLRVAFAVGDFTRVLELGERFRTTWDRAGRPGIGQLGPSAWSVMATHRLRGEDALAAEWKRIHDELRRSTEEADGYPKAHDALVALHHGDPHAALSRLPDDPAQSGSGPSSAGGSGWHFGLWRPWWAAYWAEASVLADIADAAERIERARVHVQANPIASAIVDRAAALLVDDLDAVLATGAALAETGCRYQHARTLVLAGGEHAAEGTSALKELGIS